MKNPTITTKDIQQQAKRMRDIAQSIIDDIEARKPINNYARSVLAGGQFAQDAAILGIMVIANELQNEE